MVKMCYVFPVANFENNKSTRIQEKTCSASYRQGSPNGTRAVSRPSQLNQGDIKCLSTNGNRNHGRGGTQEASTKTFINESHRKNDQTLHRGNENNKDKGSSINIRVHKVGEDMKTSPIKDGTKHQHTKRVHSHQNQLHVDRESSQERGNKKPNSDKKTVSRSNTSSKTKDTNKLEVDWTHLKTPPTTRKVVAKSPSQTQALHSNKNISSSSSSHSIPHLERNSSNRKVAQKARTTNLALSINVAQSANISHSDAKIGRETEEEKRLKVTKQRGREQVINLSN